MLSILPISDLRNNANEISDFCRQTREPVYITRNGKTIAKLTSPYQNKLNTVESLFGSVPATMTLEQAREERLGKL